MQSWQLAWHEGFVPGLTVAGLEKLKAAIIADDPRLIQRATVKPMPILCSENLPVEAACALGYCGWQGESLSKINEVEEFFVKAYFDADQRLYNPGACRQFLIWFDTTPHDQMRKLLLPEVELALLKKTESAT